MCYPGEYDAFKEVSEEPIACSEINVSEEQSKDEPITVEVQQPESAIVKKVDNRIPLGVCKLTAYCKENYPHICKNRPLPQQEGIRFLFGAEVDMTLDGTVGVSLERLAELDYVLISISHFHCTDFTIRAEDAATTEGSARVLLEKLETLLDMPLPWHKIGLAHLVGQKVSGGDPDRHCEILRLLQGERLTALFQKAARLGVGIELNTATFSFGNDAEREAVTAFYAHAKECGCKFYFGSDAHAPFQSVHHRERAQAMADALNLTEEDIFRI